MKHEREYKRIGDICNIKTGKLDANASSPDGKYPFFTCSKEALRIDSFSYDEECVLIAGNGDLNVKYYKGKFDAYQRTYIVSLKECVFNVSSLYLYHFFSKYIEHLRNVSIGGVIKYIKLNNLTDAIVPVPPLSVQEQIASELEKVSEVIEKKKQQVKELDTLAQSIFYDMFGDPITNEKGWDVKKMKDVAPISEYKGTPPNNAGKYWLLNLDKIESQTGRVLDVDYFDKSEIGTSVVSFDDSNVLYSKLRPYLNKVVIPHSAGYASSELLPLKPQKDVLNRYYLALMLRSKSFVSFINIKVAGAKMPRVSMDTFRDFPVPVPPLPLQRSFAEKIEAIERQKGLINRSIKEVQTLFDSRMDYYFGE